MTEHEHECRICEEAEAVWPMCHCGEEWGEEIPVCEECWRAMGRRMTCSWHGV